MKSIVKVKSVMVVSLLLVALGMVACNGDDDVPPTEVRVITSTPNTDIGGENQIQATVDAMADNQSNLQATIDAQATEINDLSSNDATTFAEKTEVAAIPTNTPTPELSPTPTQTEIPPGVFPTPLIEQAVVVEQVFENGRMFWFRDRRYVWVAVGDEVDPTSGDWFCFEDTFVEGDVESLPELEPSEDMTTESIFDNANPQQPIRGFGKIWREQDELREQLGWALAPEIEINTRRDYLAGGVVNEDNEYEPASGEWRIFSFYNQSTFTFLEDEIGMSCPTGTWRSRPN